MPLIRIEGVRGSNPLSSTRRSWSLTRSEALRTGPTLVPRVGLSGWLGGIWEIIFSLSSVVGASCWVTRGVAGWVWWARSRCGARSPSSSGTGECAWMAARARRESSQRAWSTASRSSRIRSEAWGVKAALAWYLVAKPLLGKDLGNAVFGHPGLMTVSEPVWGEAELDREPAGDRDILGNAQDAPAAWRDVLCGARLGGWPHGKRRTGPDRGIGNDQSCRPTWPGFVSSITGRAEHPAGVVAAPIVTAVRAEENVQAAGRPYQTLERQHSHRAP